MMGVGLRLVPLDDPGMADPSPRAVLVLSAAAEHFLSERLGLGLGSQCALLSGVRRQGARERYPNAVEVPRWLYLLLQVHDAVGLVLGDTPRLDWLAVRTTLCRSIEVQDAFYTAWLLGGGTPGFSSFGADCRGLLALVPFLEALSAARWVK